MSKSKQLLEAIGRKTVEPVSKPDGPKPIEPGVDAAAAAMQLEESMPDTEESVAERKVPKAKSKPQSPGKPNATSPKRALSVVLTKEEMEVLQNLQLQMQRKYNRSFGLSHGIKVMIRAFDLDSNISSIAEALIAEDQRGKR